MALLIILTRRRGVLLERAGGFGLIRELFRRFGSREGVEAALNTLAQANPLIRSRRRSQRNVDLMRQMIGLQPLGGTQATRRTRAERQAERAARQLVGAPG